MTQQDARSLQVGDKIAATANRVFRVVEVTNFTVTLRAPHAKSHPFHIKEMKRFQRMPESTRKGRRAA